MTIFGKSEKQFENFIVADGAIKFPELGEKGPSIKIVPGYSVITDETSNVVAAAKAILANVVGGQLTKEKTTQLSLNGNTIVVLTDSLTDFVKTLGSSSKTNEDISSIFEELADQPVALGAFVAGIIANTELTQKLEKAAIVEEEAGELVTNTPLKTKLAIENTLFSKLEAMEFLKNPKARDRFQQNQIIAKINEKASEKAYADARQIVPYIAPKATYAESAKKLAASVLAAVTSNTAKKVALAALGTAALAATFFYATPENLKALFVEEAPVVAEETSYALPVGLTLATTALAGGLAMLNAAGNSLANDIGKAFKA